MGTKFVWPDPGPKFKDVNLTAAKEERWKKWIGLYNEKMLSKGEFRDLYVTGYDMPEGYAIAKDGKMYYAFFTPSGSWKGEVELRGLKPGKYRVSDYSEDKDLGTVDAASRRRGETDDGVQGSSAARGQFAAVKFRGDGGIAGRQVS